MRSPSKNDWIKYDRWKLGELLGSGTSGAVYKCMNDKGQLFALKKQSIGNDKESYDKLINEIEIMSMLSHPNIVGYKGVKMNCEENDAFIFLELVSGGSIASLLSTVGPFQVSVIKGYLQQILCGLDFLHKKDIIHRDIKGANILVDTKGRLKLADFGASKLKLGSTLEMSNLTGTPYFMAPEVLGQNKYGRKGDIWAVGCTIIEMLTASPPWKDRNLTGIVQLHALLQSWDGPPPYGAAEVSPALQECLELCFKKNPEERPTASDLLGCDFLSKSRERRTSSHITSIAGIELHKTNVTDIIDDGGVKDIDLVSDVSAVVNSSDQMTLYNRRSNHTNNSKKSSSEKVTRIEKVTTDFINCHESSEISSQQQLPRIQSLSSMNYQHESNSKKKENIRNDSLSSYEENNKNKIPVINTSNNSPEVEKSRRQYYLELGVRDINNEEVDNKQIIIPYRQSRSAEERIRKVILKVSSPVRRKSIGIALPSLDTNPLSSPSVMTQEKPNSLPNIFETPIIDSKQGRGGRIGSRIRRDRAFSCPNSPMESSHGQREMYGIRKTLLDRQVQDLLSQEDLD